MLEQDDGSGRVRWGWLRWAAIAAVVVVVLGIGAVQAREKFIGVRNVTFIGHADAAVYALMGESIARGEGLQVRYVSWFFEKYDAGIVRREDHWPPLMGMSIAPFYWMWGVSAAVARVPAVMYGSIALPLAAGLVAYGVGRRGTGALLAGLLVMGNALVFEESLKTLSDVANAVMLCGWCGCLLMTREKKWMHVAAGIFLGMAYFAKGSEVMLLVLQVPVAVLVGGMGTLRRRWVWIGLGTALVVISPYWWGNWRAYGNPLHSTQNYVSGYFGLSDWETKTYFPYEGVDVPRTSDRWEKYGGWSGAYGKLVRVQAGETAGLVISGGAVESIGELRRAWSAGGWVRVWLLAGLCGIAAILLGGLWACVAAWRRFFSKKTLSIEMSGRVGGALAVALVIAAHGGFLVLLWSVQPRFCIGMMVLLAAVGCAGVVRAVEEVVLLAMMAWRRWRGGLMNAWSAEGRVMAGRWATLAACGLAMLASPLILRAERDRVDVARWARNEDSQNFTHMGQWIRDNRPTAVIMCRNPWELLFYCAQSNRAVGLPDPQGTQEEQARRLFGIARYYGVTHIYADELRGCMVPYVRGQKPGLVREKDAPGGLYRIDWQAMANVVSAGG